MADGFGGCCFSSGLKTMLKISYDGKSGRWGRRPRQAVAVGVPTNGLHGDSKSYF